MATGITYSYKINATGNLIEVNKQAASINKNMKEAAVSSGRLGKAAGDALAATNSQNRARMDEREYERARGVTGKTGASGRDFAKQAEGLGGLVRLYATFAANIFAVTQAFEVLKRSFQFEQLQKASDAFAVTTGKNLSGIAKELRLLSDGALTNKAAQQFANYGQSAGFTADQMRRLVGVARGASQALGRDFSDAIDRLVRGTGKLEPELLDEIGILTRTKKAGEEYAKSIGKTFEQLTQFEKVQAFTNAVIEEGERKFGAVAKAVPVSAFERFAAAAIDAGTAVANFVNKAIVPLLDVLANNPALIIAGLIATIAKLANTALPFINNLAAKARQGAAEQAKYAADKEKEALRAYQAVARAKQTELMHGVNAAKIAADRFVEGEERKIQAIQKRAAAEAAAREVRGSKPNETINAVRGVNLTNAAAVQAKIAAELKSQEGMIAAINAKAAAGQAINQKSLNTHQSTVAYLKSEEAAIKELVASQAKLNALKQVQVQEEAKITALMEKEVVVAQKQASTDQLRAQRANAIYQSVNAAQQSKSSGLGIASAFKILNNELGTINTKFRETNQEIIKSGGTISNWSKITFAAGQGTAYLTGAVKILGTGLIGLATGLASALGILSLVYFAIDGIIKISGGYSDKIDAAKESTDQLTKSLELGSKQIFEFSKVQLENTGSLQGWVTVAEYSSNVLGTFSDNLKKASQDLMDFQLSSGAVSKAWQSLLSIFNKDIFTQQTKNIKDSIVGALSVTSGEDKKKVQDAILSLFPSASTIDEALKQFERLSDVQKTLKGLEVSSALGKIDSALKSNASNLKAANEAWTKLGESLDKYNEKTEVKDPKLKDTVNALRAIEAAYTSAASESEKVKILSGATKEQVENLVKLGKERNIDMSAWVNLIEQAKVKNKEILEDQKQQVVQQRELQLQLANSFLNQPRTTLFGMEDPYGPGPQFQKEAETAYEAIKQKIRETQNLDREGAANLLRELGDAYDKLFKLRTARMQEGNIAERAAVQLVLAEQEADFKAHSDTISILLRRGIVTGVKEGVTDSSAIIAAEIDANIARGAKPLEAEAAKKAIEDAKKATDALAASNSKAAKEKAVMSKFYDLDVKNAQKELAVVKEIASIQQQAVGYVSSRIAEDQKAAALRVVELQRVKEIAELERDDAKRRKDKTAYNKSQLELDKASKDLANENAQIASEAVRIENLKLALTREKVRFEKEAISFLRESLEIQNQIVDVALTINNIDTLQSSILKANINFEKESLAIVQKRFELAQREKLLNEGRGRDGETAATIAAEKALIDLTEERAKITKELTIEQAKFNEYIANVKADLAVVNSNLELQLNFVSELSSGAARQQQAIEQIKLLATDIVIEFDKLPKSQQNAINLENMLLEAANKVLETKRQIYELNTRSGSNADFNDTVKQGLELAVLDFAKTSKSLAKTTVDAMTGAIDAVVDTLFDKMKKGGKITISELVKAGTDFVKNALLDFVSQEVKMFLKNSLVGLFGGETAQQQEQRAISELKREIEKSADAYKDMKKPTESLIEALNRNTEALLSKVSTGGGGIDMAGFRIDPFSSLPPAISTVTQNILDLSNTTDIFGDDLFKNSKQTSINTAVQATNNAVVAEATQSVKAFASSLGSIVGGGGGGIGSLLNGLGSIFGGGAGVKGIFANLFGGSASELAPDFVGPPSPGTQAGVGAFEGIMGGASTGAAVGSLAASLFGNERNSKGMQLGGTIGGIAGTFLTPILGPLGPIIGSALGSALGSLWKSGGGPKSGGFAQSGTGFERFYTPSDKDSELAGQIKNISSSYDAIIGKLGGSGSAQFGLGFDTDPKGTANSRVTSGVIVNGRTIQNTVEAGRSAEELTAAIEEQSKQLVLIAIKNSDLPENVAAYYAGISEEAIKEMDSETIESKLDFGTILGAISKSRDKIAELFGEDLYNLTEEQLQPFNKGTEKLSETFARLTQEFTATNRVAKYLGVSVEAAFGTVGLASTEMREKLIEGAGGIDAFVAQFDYFIENFYSEAERAGIEFATAGENLRRGFAGLSISIPTTMEGYRRAVTDALAAGNLELYNSLMELAPAFNEVVGAIERVNASIAGMASNFLDEIAAGTQTAEQRYETFRGRANDAQAEIDEIMQMTPEALIQAVQAGTITPAQIEELASSAIDNARSAWNLLDENQKKVLGPEFERFTTNLTSNVSAVLEAINTAIMAGPKPEPKTPADGTTPETVVPPSTEELLAVPDRVSTAIVDSLTSGAEIVRTSIVNAFSSISLENVATEGAGPLGSTPDQLEAQRAREEAALVAQMQLEEQKRVSQENHAAALAAMAEKVLGAANGMLEAAANMQAAASTPQQVNVTVQTLDDNVAAEVGV